MIIMWIKQVWHCTQHRHQMEALGSFVPLEKECLKQAAPNKGEVSKGQRCRWNWAEKDFYSRLQESFHPWENMIQAMLPRSQRAQDRNMLRESSWGSLGWPGSSNSLYTSFSMSCKLLSTLAHTGKPSIWRTHAPVSQITLAGEFFCSLEKYSSFETLIKC